MINSATGNAGGSAQSLAEAAPKAALTTLYRRRGRMACKRSSASVRGRPTRSRRLLASPDDSAPMSRSDVSHHGTCQPFHDWFAGRCDLRGAEDLIADSLRINQSIALTAQVTDYRDIGIGL